jgi:hypothetical protein
VTNGVAQITGDLVADKEFLLQKLYVQILADASDEAFVRDPASTLFPGQRRATSVLIGEVDVAADFVVVFRAGPVFPKYLRIWLEAPDGTVIEPADQGSGVNMTFHVHPTSVFFRVGFPVVPGRPGTHAGRWRLWVENASGQVVEIAGAFSSGALLSYATMVKARSDLRVAGHLVQPVYAPGSPMTVVLEPTLYGLPAALDPPVRVTVVRPDSVSRTVTLARDDVGSYRGQFTDTGALGAYLFTADVAATTPLGNRVTRYRQLTGIILRPGGGQDGGGQDGGGCGCGCRRECRCCSGCSRCRHERAGIGHTTQPVPHLPHPSTVPPA